MLHKKIYSKVRVRLPLTYSWGAVWLYKVIQTNGNGYTKLHQVAVVTQRQNHDIYKEQMKLGNFRVSKEIEEPIN